MPRGGSKSPATDSMISRSAPTSPKNLHELTKLNSLPQSAKSDVGVSMNTVNVTAVSSSIPMGATPSPRKSRNATLTNFLKKLSPKLRQSSSGSTSSTTKIKDKNWYVVDIDDDIDNRSNTSSSGCVPSCRRAPPSTSLPSGIAQNKLRISTVSDQDKRKDQDFSKERFDGQKQVSRGNDKLIATQPLIRIDDTDCSPPAQPAGARLKRTQQPPKTLNILNKIVVHHPVPDRDSKKTITNKMASVDSIGSCSLDIDATASESSTTADGQASSISQRTLHSVSVEFSSLSTSTAQQVRVGRMPRSPTRLSTSNACGGVGGPDDKQVTFVSELYIPNGSLKCCDEVDRSAIDQSGSNDGSNNQQTRKPSYIGISCSVSGYNSYSCYNSKASSRDNSPARLAFEHKEEKHTNSVMLNINGSKPPDVVDCSSKGSRPPNIGNGRRSVYRDRFSGYSDDGFLETVAAKRFGPATIELIDGNNNNNDDLDEDDINRGVETDKSLIEQRIERLYGPAALAQGFRLHRTQRTQNGSKSTTLSSSETITTIKSSPNKQNGNSFSAFKHFRQNFTEQTETANGTTATTSKAIPSAPKISTIQIHVDPVDENITLDQTKLVSNGNNAVVNSKREPLEINVRPSNETISDVKDADWYLQVMSDERDKIKALVTKAEGYLESGSLPEDACGRLRAAIGKANLLVAQKFQQFRGLCEKNLMQGVGEPFPTTVSDLAGFWDMVLIQVDDIHRMFAAIEQMRDNGWIVDEKDGISHQSTNGVIKTKKVALKPTASSGIPVVATATVKAPARSAKADEAARVRMEARKRLLEAKRKGRQQTSADETATNAPIEIYVPDKE